MCSTSRGGMIPTVASDALHPSKIFYNVIRMQPGASKLRKTTFQHFEQCCSNNVPVSALFSCPGVSLSSFQIDWLHAVDLGVCL